MELKKAESKFKVQNQVKSRQRIVDHGEVFTANREVNAMLDLVKQETERIDSRFLEPACGTGNFLTEVLKRKLAVVESKYKKHQLEYERNAVVAVSSIYGVEILIDNVTECRQRLYSIFNKQYTNLFKAKCNEDCRDTVLFVLNRNILWGDALDFTNPKTKEPIVFAHWSTIKGSLIKRRDFVYKFLVENKKQISKINDEGNFTAINQPIKEYPVAHFLKLKDYA